MLNYLQFCCDAMALLITNTVKTANLHVVRGDYFEGFYLRHIDSNGQIIDYSNSTICVEIYENNTLLFRPRHQTYQDSLGWVTRVWMPETQTVQLQPSDPPCWGMELDDRTPYRWFLTIKHPDIFFTLLSVESGVFTTLEDHELAPGDKIVFSGVVQAPTLNNVEFTVTTTTQRGFGVSGLSNLTVTVLDGRIGHLRVNTLMAGYVLSEESKKGCFSV